MCHKNLLSKMLTFVKHFKVYKVLHGLCIIMIPPTEAARASTILHFPAEEMHSDLFKVKNKQLAELGFEFSSLGSE